MKKLRYLLLAVLVLPFCFMFGCQQKNFVTKIEKTGLNGSTETYTVYYSNGTTSTISVENGTNGQDGQDLNLQQLFNECVKNGLYANTNDGYKQFLQDYVQNRTTGNENILQAMNSAVAIYCAFQREDGRFNIAAGSGVVWQMNSDYSYIVTNCHVVANAASVLNYQLPKEIMVFQYGANIDVKANNNGFGAQLYTFKGGTNATCIAYSIEFDLAVLQLPTKNLLQFNPNTCAVKLAQDYALAEQVFAIGNPEAEGFSVTNGIVSVFSEEIYIGGFPADNSNRYYRVLRTDAAIYGGNSGGGLFNQQGELVGIVNASTNDADNYNFALPIGNVKNVVENMLFYFNQGNKTYTLKYLSMQELGLTIEEEFVSFNSQTGQLTYNVVADVENDSILANAGLQTGDTINSIKIGNTTCSITHGYEIEDFLITARDNSIIQFNITRGELPLTINLYPANFNFYI